MPAARMSDVQDLGSAAALFLAAAFAWAGALKLVSPARTAHSFRDLGLPASGLLARAVPLFELATATLLLVVPRVGALLALGALALFTAVVVSALRHGRRAGCGCFGAARSDDDLSYVEPARNALLAIGAVTALLTWEVRIPSLAATVAVSSAALTSFLVLGLLRLRRRLGAVWATPLPGSIPRR